MMPPLPPPPPPPPATPPSTPPLPSPSPPVPLENRNSQRQGYEPGRTSPRPPVTGGEITGPTKPPPAAPRRATAGGREFVLIQSAHGSSSGGSRSDEKEGQDADEDDMLSIQLMSDLYLEPRKGVRHRFSVGATHLALLGNLGSFAGKRGAYLRSVLASVLLPRFEVVLMVPGNAEVHGTSWGAMMRDMDRFQRLLAVKRGRGARLGSFCLLNRTTYVFSNSPLPSSSSSPSSLSPPSSPSSPSPPSSSSSPSSPSPPSSSSEGGGSDGDGDGQQQGGRDIAILGCPLFSHIPDSEAEKTSFGQNDFLLTKDWSVEKHNAAHAADLAWLNRRTAELERDETVGAVVIMTHWSPTTHPRTRSGRESFRKHGGYFATDLSREPCWNAAKVRAWCWGHTHCNVDLLLPGGRRGRRGARRWRRSASCRTRWASGAEGRWRGRRGSPSGSTLAWTLSEGREGCA